MLTAFLKRVTISTVLLSLVLSLIFFLFGYYTKESLLNSEFKIPLKDLKYKFAGQNASSGSELILFQERMKHLIRPSDLDYSTLAELHIGEAKRTGSATSFDTAEKMALESIKLNSRNRNAHTTLIKILTARHQFKEALTKIDELFGLEVSVESAALRATVYLALGRYSDALKQVNDLIKLKPDLGSATLKALALGHVGQDQIALHYFLRALQIEDLNEELQSTYTRGQLAQLLIKKGNFQQAIQLCNLALDIIPDSPFILSVKAEALVAQKEYKMALSELQTAFAKSKEPTYLLGMVMVSKLLNRENDFKVLSEQALKIYEAEAAANNYGHLADLGSLYYVTGQYQKAFDTYNQNRNIRKSVKADIALAKTLIRLNKPEAAREIIEENILSGSTEVSLFYLMIDLLKGEHNENLRRIYREKIKLNNTAFNQEILMIIP